MSSVRLYVGNLPKDTVERQELQEVFGEANDSLSIKVIKDRKTGNCRGFAFVTVPNDEIADKIIEEHNGQTFRDNPLKIEKALPRNKNKGEENASNKEGASEQSRESSRPVKQKDKEKDQEKEGASSNKRRNKSNKKSKQPAANNSSGNTATQPDPRWADELAELKKRLSAIEK